MNLPFRVAAAAASAALILCLLAPTTVDAFLPGGQHGPLSRTGKIRHGTDMILVGAVAEPATEIESSSTEPVGAGVVDFPPPLSRMDRLKRAATFWSSALPIIANYYGVLAEMKLREEVLGETMTMDEIQVSLSS